MPEIAEVMGVASTHNVVTFSGYLEAGVLVLMYVYAAWGYR